MPSLKRTVDTAFLVAAFRADEIRQEDPLFHDSFSHLFLDEELKLLAESLSLAFPPSPHMVRVRTRYLDDMLTRRIEAGTRQVVLLGGGLDTRPLRKAAKDVRYFDVDEEKILRFKEDRIKRAGLRCNVSYVPMNYLEGGFADKLWEHGCDLNQPTFFIWEGQTFYMEDDAVRAVLREIREGFRDFHLSFDYMLEKVVRRETGREEIDGYLDRFAEMGAPWMGGVSCPEKLSKELGLRFIEAFMTADLYNRYRPGAFFRSELFFHYFVGTLSGG
jgi:methyltransferase (TIGR00027 family)